MTLSPASSHSSALSRADVTLTAAQVLGMFAAPVQIVPAQGAGSLIVPIFATARSAGTTNYNDPGGALGALGYTGGTSYYTFTGLVTLLVSSDPPSFIAHETPGSLDDPANFAGLPLVLSNDTGALTLGDLTLAVTVLYIVVAV